MNDVWDVEGELILVLLNIPLEARLTWVVIQSLTLASSLTTHDIMNRMQG